MCACRLQTQRSLFWRLAPQRTVGYFIAMKSAFPALHLLLALVLLLSGLPSIANAGITESAMAGMEECPMAKGGAHTQAAEHGQSDGSNSVESDCPDTSCDHACVHHGGATPSSVISLHTTPVSSAAEIAYAAAFSSLSAVTPFRPPIV